MREVKIGPNEAGQRLDRLLARYLPEAGKGFLYRMIRKKNITLNDARCEGNEKLAAGDTVRIWLSEETIGRFAGSGNVPALSAAAGADSRSGTHPAGRPANRPGTSSGENADQKLLPVIFEDSQVVIVNKPAGMLSQKAAPGDVSANERILLHLLQNGSLREEELRTFRPSVCNRLDRNTSGLLLAGKTLPALQILSEAIRSRAVKKEYLTVVRGIVKEPLRISGYLVKDAGTNTVRVSDRPATDEDRPIETAFRPLYAEEDRTLLLVHLITGRTHQIRAHLSSVGHPVAGDPKYGDPVFNRALQKRFGIRSQMLHAWRLTLPELPEPLRDLSGKEFRAPVPENFRQVMKGYAWEHGKPEV